MKALNFITLSGIIISFLLFYRCDNGVKPDEELFKLHVIPDNCNIGDKIKLFNKKIDSDLSDYYLLFPQTSNWIASDSIHNDTIYTYVPFTSLSGIIHIYHSDITSEYLTINDYPIGELSICWSDLNYQITKTMSQTAWIENKRWTTEKNSDTIRIYGFHPTGDYSTLHILTLLDKGKDILPDFISGETLMLPDYPETTHYHLNTGIIKIQDWDTENLISGRVFADPNTSYYNNYVFWYNFKTNE